MCFLFFFFCLFFFLLVFLFFLSSSLFFFLFLAPCCSPYVAEQSASSIRRPEEIPPREISLIEEIGSGHFGSVFKATRVVGSRSSGGYIVAVKVCANSKTKKEEEEEIQKKKKELKNARGANAVLKLLHAICQASDQLLVCLFLVLVLLLLLSLFLSFFPFFFFFLIRRSRPIAPRAPSRHCWTKLSSWPSLIIPT